MIHLLALLDTLDTDELGLEDEGGVGGDDATDSAVAVGEVRGDSELALLANLHAEETLIPALDDLALANGEVERLAAVVASVELLAAGEDTLVVDVDVVA